jgi:hypothetical protein
MMMMHALFGNAETVAVVTKPSLDGALHGMSINECISREIRKSVAGTAYGRVGSSLQSPTVSNQDAQVLLRLVKHIMEERSRKVDQPLLEVLHKVLRGFVGKGMLASADEIARQVSSIIFQEELHTKVVAQVARCYDLELADLHAASSEGYATPRNASHPAEQCTKGRAR